MVNSFERTDIVALGEPLMELSALERGGLDTVSHFLAGYGGDAANFAVAARRCGASVGIMTRLGDDQFGQAFMTLWEEEGIDTSLVERDETAPTGLYLIARNPGRHDFTYYRAGSAASALSPRTLSYEVIRGAGLLHVTGVTQGISTSACDAAFAAMEAAREAGVLVSYDLNYRPNLWPLARARAIIHASIAMADIALPSVEEAEMMLGLSDPVRIVNRYLELGAGTVALKLGKGGALIANRERMLSIPGIEVEAVDTSGAGDTFAGAFATAFLEGRSLDWCGRFAVAAAGLSTKGLGCVGPIPRREEILSHMQNGSEVCSGE